MAPPCPCPLVRARPVRRAGRRVVVAIAAAGFVGAPVRASPPEAGDVIATAEAAFEVGLSRWRRGNYGGAVDAWTRAHRLLDQSDEIGMQRILGFDLAQAHMRVFVVDHDAAHLSAARTLLEDYIVWIERPGHARSRQEEADRDHALELLAIVEIEQAGRARAPVPPSPAPKRDPPPPPPGPSELRQEKRLSTRLIIGGSVSLGLGVVFAGAFGGLASMTPQGSRVDGPAPPGAEGVILTGVLMTSFTLAGATALTIGLVKRRQLVAVHPTLARRHAGLAVRFSF